MEFTGIEVLAAQEVELLPIIQVKITCLLFLIYFKYFHQQLRNNFMHTGVYADAKLFDILSTIISWAFQIQLNYQLKLTVAR